MSTKKRQLQFPGLPRSGTPPGDRMKRAKKDLSAAAFGRALERWGFRSGASGLVIADTTGSGGLYAAVCRAGHPIRIARRATLAKVIRERSEAEKLNRNACPSRIANGGET